MSNQLRIEILRLITKQSGKLIIVFLLDGKRMELENLEFEKRFGSIEDYEKENKGVKYVEQKQSKPN
ncbi:MAG: hypothetical protein AB7U51_12425 [Arcobacter sp.]|uniref:hypothetical protein n=1 Tax=Arcobacter sp. TaxID=1872629 RepID=UPI003D027459